MSVIGNNELWQAFFTEVSEQLDGLELILADNDADSNADIHQLFRDFHTIKSSCAMMDFYSMERIAHASEDYLDLVRKGRTVLTKPAINQLLDGIDWLKSQLQFSKNTGNPPKENPELVETLRLLSAAYADQASKQNQNIENGESGNSHESAQLTLSQDEIEEFASACRQELLIGLSPGAETTKIKRALNKIVSICNLVGFTAISSLLKKYIRLTNPLDENRATATAAEIIERIITLEKLYSVDCGSSSLRTAFLDAMFADFTQLSGRLDYLLDLIESNPEDTETVGNCERLLITLGINASLFGYSDLLNFFRYVLQTIRSIRRGDIPDRRAAFYAVRQAVDFPIAEKIQDGETDTVRSELQTRLSDLNFAISQAIYSAGNEHSKENIYKSIEIDRDTLDILMPESLSHLSNVTTKGGRIFEIDIDISQENQATEETIQWIRDNGEIIHNRSVFESCENADRIFSNIIRFICAFNKDFPDESIATLVSNINLARCKEIPYRGSQEKPAEKQKQVTPEIAPDSKKTQDSGSHSNTNFTLRIESHTLDNLVTQAGEMIMAHNMMLHEFSNPEFESVISIGKTLISESNNNLLDKNHEAAWGYILNTLMATHQKIVDSNTRMQKSVNAIQDRILDLRVIPVSSVFNRIPQLVKKMAESQNKKIQLVIAGKEVRIDKGMVDILMEPLIHLVRNCIDHGIENPDDRLAAGKHEEATLTLSAFQEGSTLILEIADDGRGINLERIRESAIKKGFILASDVLSDQETCKLIFLPGFSTAEVITETSGRGVGMDVVITRINHIGGDIDVHTTPGHGTRFTMTLPLSAAIQSVMMARANRHLYAIPQNSVIEIISLSPDAVSSILGQSAFILRGAAIPLFNLEDLVLKKGITKKSGASVLQFPPAAVTENTIVIILGKGMERIGVVVEAIQGREDVFVRELHKDLRSMAAICGATALGTGELAFILNSNFLLQYSRQGSAAWLNRYQTST